jgi:hypothetical protein
VPTLRIVWVGGNRTGSFEAKIDDKKDVIQYALHSLTFSPGEIRGQIHEGHRHEPVGGRIP